MGLFGKLAFWKKKDDFSDMKPGKDPFGADFGNPPGPPDTMGGPDPFANPPGMPPPHEPMGDPNSPLMSPPTPQFPQDSPPGYQPPGGMGGPPSTGPDSDYINSKNLEVISSKIDAIRATLDSINSRLAHLEHIAGAEEEQRRRKYY